MAVFKKLAEKLKNFFSPAKQVYKAPQIAEPAVPKANKQSFEQQPLSTYKQQELSEAVIPQSKPLELAEVQLPKTAETKLTDVASPQGAQVKSAEPQLPQNTQTKLSEPQLRHGYQVPPNDPTVTKGREIIFSEPPPMPSISQTVQPLNATVFSAAAIDIERISRKIEAQSRRYSPNLEEV